MLVNLKIGAVIDSSGSVRVGVEECVWLRLLQGLTWLVAHLCVTLATPLMTSITSNPARTYDLLC